MRWFCLPSLLWFVLWLLEVTRGGGPVHRSYVWTASFLILGDCFVLVVRLGVMFTGRGWNRDERSFRVVEAVTNWASVHWVALIRGIRGGRGCCLVL